MKVFKFFVIFVLLLSAEAVDDDPIVNTCHGLVQGVIAQAHNGRKFFAFKGIPYAKPPIGELRFKPPVPPEPWENIRNAQRSGPVCIQKNYIYKPDVIEGSEDCLTLNIYTPKLDIKKPKLLLPVLVVIHGGGYFSGYANDTYIGPEYILDNDIVMVTINYRLGIFGFFSTSSDDSPGNYGLKDQVAALKWLRDNIDRFGGSKKRVTLFGNGAGAASIHLHMLSPLAKHLFHGAITSSGVALNLWSKPLIDQAEVADKLYEAVGCDEIATPKYRFHCLQKADAKKIVKSADDFKIFNIDPLTIFQPVIEKETSRNPNPYITKDPIRYIQSNEIQKVPWIVGMVQDEGIIRAASFIRDDELRQKLDEKFDDLMPLLLGVDASTKEELIDEAWDQIKLFYFHGVNSIEPLNRNIIRSLIDVYTDRSYIYGIHQTVLLHASQGHCPWIYNFAYKGRYSYGSFVTPRSDDEDDENEEDNSSNTEDDDRLLGVSHGDDTVYLFKTPELFPDFKNPTDIIMRNAMVKMVINFVTHSNPLPKNEVLGIPVQWDQIPDMSDEKILLNEEIIYLNISGPYLRDKIPLKLKIHYGLYPKRMNFWNSLPLKENVDNIRYIV